jgi:multidrug efflux pump subunit AcrB
VAVAKPVVFAVLTTMIAFAPWFFLDVEGGHATRQFSIVITVALTISLIEAFFILPSHLRHLEHREHLVGWRARQRKLEESILHFADTHYRALLGALARRRYLTVSVFVALFTVSLGLLQAGWVKTTFFPEVSNDQIYINVVMPAGTPYARSLEILDRLQKAEKRLIAEVEREAADSGGSGRLIEGWYTRSRRDSVIAIVRLRPAEERDLTAREAVTRLKELLGDIPDADEIQISYTLNDQGPALTYVLRHRDMATLRAASAELQASLRGYDGAYYVRDSLRGESDELHLQLRPGAEQLGITLAEVSRQVRQAYYGEEVQRLPRENGDVRVMLKYPQALRESLSSLEQFRVRTVDGRELPLLSVVDIEVTSGVQRIERRDGQRTMEVFADAVPELASDIDRDVREQLIPELKERYPGLAVLPGGQQETQQDFFNQITALYAVAAFVMYTLIAVAFRSYALPLLIMTAIPYAFMGAILGHLLFGMPLALFSYFGMGAAAGVVVNDNLVLVDFIQRLRRQGSDALTAVIEAGVQRFRPILLTSITTFVGLIPIMAERSMDAQFLKPAVLSLAFGVACALFVSLLMVPALYLAGDDLRRLAGNLRRRLLPAGPRQGADARH